VEISRLSAVLAALGVSRSSWYYKPKPSCRSRSRRWPRKKLPQKTIAAVLRMAEDNEPKRPKPKRFEITAANVMWSEDGAGFRQQGKKYELLRTARRVRPLQGQPPPGGRTSQGC